MNTGWNSPTARTTARTSRPRTTRAVRSCCDATGVVPAGSGTTRGFAGSQNLIETGFALPRNRRPTPTRRHRLAGRRHRRPASNGANSGSVRYRRGLQPVPQTGQAQQRPLDRRLRPRRHRAVGRVGDRRLIEPTSSDGRRMDPRRPARCPARSAVRGSQALSVPFVRSRNRGWRRPQGRRPTRGTRTPATLAHRLLDALRPPSRLNFPGRIRTGSDYSGAATPTAPTKARFEPPNTTHSRPRRST
jgi:hypothetical protein